MIDEPYLGEALDQIIKELNERFDRDDDDQFAIQMALEKAIRAGYAQGKIALIADLSTWDKVCPKCGEASNIRLDIQSAPDPFVDLWAEQYGSKPGDEDEPDAGE